MMKIVDENGDKKIYIRKKIIHNYSEVKDYHKTETIKRNIEK